MASPVQPEPEPASVSPPAKPYPAASVPLAEVPIRADDVSSYLDALKAQSAESTELVEIRANFSKIQTEIVQGLEELQRSLGEQPTLETLQQLQHWWQAAQLQLNRWLTVISGRGANLKSELESVGKLDDLWRLTQAEANRSKALPAVVERVASVVADLAAARSSLEAQRSAVLALEVAVAKEAARCQTALGKISEAQETAVGGMLARTTLPVWSAELRQRARSELPERLDALGRFHLGQLREAARQPPRDLLLPAGAFPLLVILFGAVRRHLERSNASAGPTFEVFERPIAVALVVSLLFAAAPGLSVPQSVRMWLQVLALPPMIRLAQPRVSPAVLRALLVLSVLFALDTVRHALAGTPLVEQLVLIAEMVFLMAALQRQLTLGTLKRGIPPSEEGSRLRLLRAGAGLALTMLGVGVALSALGYLRFPRLLIAGLLVGGVQALAFFTALTILNGLAGFCLRSWPLRRLHMVAHHRDLLERRIHRVLGFGATVAWLVRSLDYIGLLAPALSLAEAVLAARLVRGEFSLSLGNVLASCLTIGLAILVSGLLRFLLREDVFPRIRTASGISYAVSRLLHYVILAVAFLFALGELGISLNRVVIFVSALGVGIGFGLQNVVNNFVSGLILLFERPMHVGDTVELGGTVGEVRQIGLRASRVHTARGADLIVPNANLVSESVTNWTLSDKLRRIDFPVGVNYGADPRSVLQLLEAVAAAHPKILASPPPCAQLTGYGDNAVNFELSAWTGHFSDWPQIRSELGVAVYDAVTAAGMQFPFPQREVRLLHDSKPKPPSKTAEGPGAGSQETAPARA